MNRERIEKEAVTEGVEESKTVEPVVAENPQTITFNELTALNRSLWADSVGPVGCDKATLLKAAKQVNPVFTKNDKGRFEMKADDLKTILLVVTDLQAPKQKQKPTTPSTVSDKTEKVSESVVDLSQIKTAEQFAAFWQTLSAGYVLVNRLGKEKIITSYLSKESTITAGRFYAECFDTGGNRIGGYYFDKIAQYVKVKAVVKSDDDKVLLCIERLLKSNGESDCTIVSVVDEANKYCYKTALGKVDVVDKSFIDDRIIAGLF